MKIKNNIQSVDDIADGIATAAKELKLSPVSCETGTAPVDEECSCSYANGSRAVADCGVSLIHLAENIKAISEDLEKADKKLIR